MKNPIFAFTYSQITYVCFATLVFNIISIIYCIKIFISAVYIKDNLGVYINMISNDGNILPTFLVIPGVLCLPTNLLCLYLLYKVFNDTKQPLFNTIMFILILALLGIICIMLLIAVMVLTHSYSTHESLHDGITEAMTNYSSDSQFKVRIDKLQIKLQCCGSKNFNEWYNITWYDTNLVKHRNNFQSTPFSCCSMSSMSMCIHHGIESNNVLYHYTRDLNFSISPFGCSTALKTKKKSAGWSIIARIIILCLLEFLVSMTLRLLQSAHSKEFRFRDTPSKVYTSWIFGSKIEPSTECNDVDREE